jgi:integrase
MLTNLACRNAKPQNTTYRLIDHSNLYLEIRPSGVKSWRYRYNIHGKENTLSIGQYPETSILDARNAMEEAKANIKKGVDPNHAKRQEQQQAEYANTQTFELVTKEWFDTYLDTWKPDTAEIIWRRFELYLFPYIGKDPIKSLTSAIMLKCFRRIEKQSHDVSTRVFKHTNKVFEHAGLTGRIDKNPLEFMYNALKKYKRGYYKSIPINQLPKLLKTLNDHNQRLYRQTWLAVRLLMLTAVRTNELIRAKWPEIDFEKALWTIPAERMKMKLEHVVPLSKQALVMFKELKEVNGHREWVFPRKGQYSKPMSNSTIIRVLERIGYKGEMTGHGFRSLFMGVAKEKLNYKHDVPDRQLAHTPKGNNGQAYDRATFLDDRIELMQEYADYIDDPTNYQPHRKVMYDNRNNGFQKQTGSIAYPNYSRDYTTRIIYRTTDLIQADKKPDISETTQRPWQYTQLLVDAGYSKTL